MANWPEHDRGRGGEGSRKEGKTSASTGGRGREGTMEGGREGGKLFVFASYYARGEDIHSHAEGNPGALGARSVFLPSIARNEGRFLIHPCNLLSFSLSARRLLDFVTGAWTDAQQGRHLYCVWG